MANLHLRPKCRGLERVSAFGYITITIRNVRFTVADPAGLGLGEEAKRRDKVDRTFPLSLHLFRPTPGGGFFKRAARSVGS